MRQFEDLAMWLPDLKGARGSVVWALSLAGRPLSLGELNTLTGYSRKPVRRAVQELIALGIVFGDGPRVYALSGDWPYRVVEKSATSAGSAASPERSWLAELIPLSMARALAELGAAEVGEMAHHPATSASETPRPAVEEMTVERGRGEAGAARPDTPGETTQQPAKRAVEEDRPADLAAEVRRALAGRMGGKVAQMTADAVELSAGGRNDEEGGQIDHESDPGDRQDQYVVVDHNDPAQSIQQQQKIPERAKGLAALLRRMGVHGRAFWRLVGREDLAARPELALAWWWYYRAQEGVRNPAGASISRLDGRDQPPEGYLALAQLWPRLEDGLRQELESMVLHNWSAEQIAARLRPECPDMTAGAVLAFMSLSLDEIEG